MSTGFGYVRDSKPNIINWADIGKQMSDAISADQADRQARKDDINKKEAEYAKSLLDQPQGSYEEANRFISDFSQQASKQALRDLQDLKRGAISEQEYYQRRANLKSGTELMFTAAKKFNENYDAALKGIQNGDQSVLLADIKAKMEGYLNFAKSGAYINPYTASVNVSTLDENGVVSAKSGDFMTASELVKLSTEGFKNFELDKTIKNISDSVGKVTIQDSSGRLVTIASLDKDDRDVLNKEIDDALNDQVSSIVGGVNSKVAASILADHSGENYNLVFDMDNTDPNKIVYDPQGNVVLTEEQLNKAKDIVKTRLLASFDRTIKEPVKKEPDARDRKEIAGRQARLENVRFLSYLYDGTDAQKQLAKDYYVGNKDNEIQDIDFTETGFTVTYTDKSGLDPIPYSYTTTDSEGVKTNKGKKDFMESITGITGLENIASELKSLKITNESNTPTIFIREGDRKKTGGSFIETQIESGVFGPDVLDSVDFDRFFSTKFPGARAEDMREAVNKIFAVTSQLKPEMTPQISVQKNPTRLVISVPNLFPEGKVLKIGTTSGDEAEFKNLIPLIYDAISLNQPLPESVLQKLE
tara:strand:+ start:3041 stop:4801 length:1761 start_codon:yes stop_codon:yes gene_type:complete